MEDVSPSISCGLFHSAVLADGVIHTWGRGQGGRLGQGDELQSSSPITIPCLESAASEVASVSLGGIHSAAVLSDGQLCSWGFGGTGALGTGVRENELEPVIVAGPWETDADAGSRGDTRALPAVSCGAAHTLVLSQRGLVYASGRDERDGRLGYASDDVHYERGSARHHRVHLPDEMSAVSAGGFFSFAISVGQGRVYAWGPNKHGELGVTGGGGPDPQVIPGLDHKGIVKVVGGGMHALALSEDGALYAWGEGRFGQLGTGDMSNCPDPAPVRDLAGEAVVSIACGARSSYAVTASGSLIAWGLNKEKQLGLGSELDVVATPMQVPGLACVVDVAAGSVHAMALTAS